MKTSSIIALIGLSVLLPLQFSCTQSTRTVNSPPIEANANALAPSEPVASESSGLVQPMHMASASEGGLITCGIAPTSSADNNE